MQPSSSTEACENSAQFSHSFESSLEPELHLHRSLSTSKRQKPSNSSRTWATRQRLWEDHTNCKILQSGIHQRHWLHLHSQSKSRHDKNTPPWQETQLTRLRTTLKTHTGHQCATDSKLHWTSEAQYLSPIESVNNRALIYVNEKD